MLLLLWNFKKMNVFCRITIFRMLGFLVNIFWPGCLSASKSIVLMLCYFKKCNLFVFWEWVKQLLLCFGNNTLYIGFEVLDFLIQAIFRETSSSSHSMMF